MTEKDVNQPDVIADGEAKLTDEAEALSVEREGDDDPLTQARLEAARLKDMWMRSAAEFDNFRKRSRKENDDARKQGQEEILKELLPVFDNLERGIQSGQRAQDVKAVVDGLQMILKQFESTLGRMNIKKVPSVGTTFNPTVHEAIQQVETDQHPAGTVIFEVQPGYTQGDKLLRAAMVVVAKSKSGDSPSGDSQVS